MSRTSPSTRLIKVAALIAADDLSSCDMRHGLSGIQRAERKVQNGGDRGKDTSGAKQTKEARTKPNQINPPQASPAHGAVAIVDDSELRPFEDRFEFQEEIFDGPEFRIVRYRNTSLGK